MRYDLSPVLKSAILPGWGQFAQERTGAAALFALGVFFTFQNYWTVRQAHAAAERDYNDPVPVGLVAAQALVAPLGIGQAFAINFGYLSNKESSVLDRQREGNMMLGAVLSIWFWNILDVIFHSDHWKKDGRLLGGYNEAIDFRLIVQKDAVSIGMSFSL